MFKLLFLFQKISYSFYFYNIFVSFIFMKCTRWKANTFAKIIWRNEWESNEKDSCTSYLGGKFMEKWQKWNNKKLFSTELRRACIIRRFELFFHAADNFSYLTNVNGENFVAKFTFIVFYLSDIVAAAVGPMAVAAYIHYILYDNINYVPVKLELRKKRPEICALFRCLFAVAVVLIILLMIIVRLSMAFYHINFIFGL